MKNKIINAANRNQVYAKPLKGFSLFLVRRITIIFSLIMLHVGLAYGHGYSEYPKARQQFCVEDGGYWWPEDGSNIPNDACRAAFLQSGTFQFVQNIEFSAIVSNYNDINAVKAVVTDGNLCSSADNAKRGMNLLSQHWQKTTINPDQNGQIEYLFSAAVPHNPSFWEFYLSKPGFDPATQSLTWNDLVLIDTASDVAVVDIGGRKMYKINVNMPSGRSGDAIFFTRWQRVDPGGEGFYNCSDIRIGDSTQVEWHDKGYFIEQGAVAEATDEIWFRVFDNVGKELVFEKLSITTENQSIAIWAKQLADRLNNSHNTHVQIGIKDNTGNIGYSSNVFSNKAWLNQTNYSFALDVKKRQNDLPPTVQLPATHQVIAGASINITTTASDPENQPLNYQWTIPAGLTTSNTSNATVNVQAGSPAQTTDYPLSVDVSDGVNTASARTTLTVTVGNDKCQITDPNAANYAAWSLGKIYNAGDEVSHSQLVWRAKWWTNSSEPRIGSTVWKLASNVILAWQLGASYNAADKVDHNGGQWQANWSNSEEPGKSDAWKRLGPATCP